MASPYPDKKNSYSNTSGQIRVTQFSYLAIYNHYKAHQSEGSTKSSSCC